MNANISTSATPQKRPRQEVAGWFACDAEINQIHKRGNSTLARGAFGEISVAIDTKRNQLVVVKTIPQAVTGGFGAPKKQLSQEVCNEIMALRILSDHPNIVSFLGLTTSSNEMMPSALCLVFDYCPMDLHTVMTRRRASLPFDTIRFITKEMLSALRHCHLNGIIHRDVTPKNFLISPQGRIWLCDFGLAKPCPHLLEGEAMGESEDKDDSKALCTLYYRPPEILLGGPAVHDSVDMYSCGLVIAELVTGRPLFAGKNVLDQLHRTFQILGTPSATEGWVEKLRDFAKVSFRHYDPQPLENMLPRADECPDLMALLKCLIVLDPSQRISATAALKQKYCHSIPIALSAIDLIPTECKSVLFSNSSLEIAEQEALSLAAARRTWNNKQEYSLDDGARSLDEVLQRQ